MKFPLKYKPYEPWDPSKGTWVAWYHQLQDDHEYNHRVMRNRERLMNIVLALVVISCLLSPWLRAVIKF